MQLRATLSSLAKEAGVALQLPKLMGKRPDASLTTILFHRFFLPDESRESGRERLRRRLGWLRESYSPLTPALAMNGLANGTLPAFPALVTVDDVSVDFIKVADIFSAFDVPAVLFACVGWSDLAGPPESRTLLARIVALLQWGDPLDLEIPFRRGAAVIRMAKPYEAERQAMIDHIIEARQELEAELPDLASRLEPGVRARTCCNWDELKDLAKLGNTIGCHSVSHIHLARGTTTRLTFEVEEARKIIEEKFGNCRHFAYPFGNRAAFSDATTAEIKKAGFESAFLTHSDFATGQTDRHHLPRLVIPDDALSLNGFRAIVRGGGIPLERAKRLIA